MELTVYQLKQLLTLGEYTPEWSVKNVKNVFDLKKKTSLSLQQPNNSGIQIKLHIVLETILSFIATL